MRSSSFQDHFRQPLCGNGLHISCIIISCFLDYAIAQLIALATPNGTMIAEILSSCSIAFAFVAGLNVVSGSYDRNRRRTVLLRIVIATVVSIVATAWVRFYFQVSLEDLGLKREGIFKVSVLSVLSAIILYTGPLVQPFFARRKENTNALQGYFHHLALYLADEIERWDIALRNLVVAPVTEEWLFRGCMLAILLPTMDVKVAVVLVPMLFGVAHTHHLLEWYRNPGYMPLSHAVTNVLFQFLYTSIFGSYAACLFVITKQIYGVILAHSFCNFMAFPNIGGIRECTHPKIVWCFYVFGLVSFFLYLWLLPYFL